MCHFVHESFMFTGSSEIILEYTRKTAFDQAVEGSNTVGDETRTILVRTHIESFGNWLGDARPNLNRGAAAGCS